MKKKQPGRPRRIKDAVRGVFILPGILLAEVKAIAEKKDRSVASVVRQALQDAVDKDAQEER